MVVATCSLFSNIGARNFCMNMRAILSDPLHSFARWIVHVYGDGSCFDHRFSALVGRADESEWGTYSTNTGRKYPIHWMKCFVNLIVSNDAERQQYYLQCTQLGGFPIADRYTWIPQNVTLAHHLRKCNEIFGRE